MPRAAQVARPGLAAGRVVPGPGPWHDPAMCLRTHLIGLVLLGIAPWAGAAGCERPPPQPQRRPAESEREPPRPEGAAPAPPPARPRHPDPAAAVDLCRAAYERAGEGPHELRLDTIVRGCAPLYVERGCRDAVAGIGRVAPDARASTMARACRDAYCPLLAEPRPALCGLDIETTSPTDLARAWAELALAIRELDLGVSTASLRSPALPLDLVQPIVVPATPARDAGPAAEAPVFGLRQVASRLELSVTLPRGGTTSLALPADPTEADYAAALARAQPLPPGRQAVISADPSIAYSEVVELIDAVRAAGYEEILISASP